MQYSIARTPAEFIQSVKSQLLSAAGGQDAVCESEGVVLTADCEATYLVHSHKEGSAHLREMTAFVLRDDATYQLNFECPTAFFETFRPTFDKIVATFRPHATPPKDAGEGKTTSPQATAATSPRPAKATSQAATPTSPKAVKTASPEAAKAPSGPLERKKT